MNKHHALSNLSAFAHSLPSTSIVPNLKPDTCIQSKPLSPLFPSPHLQLPKLRSGPKRMRSRRDIEPMVAMIQRQEPMSDRKKGFARGQTMV